MKQIDTPTTDLVINIYSWKSKASLEDNVSQGKYYKTST